MNLNALANVDFRLPTPALNSGAEFLRLLAHVFDGSGPMMPSGTPDNLTWW